VEKAPFHLHIGQKEQVGFCCFTCFHLCTVVLVSSLIKFHPGSREDVLWSIDTQSSAQKWSLPPEVMQSSTSGQLCFAKKSENDFELFLCQFQPISDLTWEK
jgi:hypothetical protein